jgi:hypothetical protein
MTIEQHREVAHKHRQSEKGKATKWAYNHTPEEMEKRRKRTSEYLSRPEVVIRERARRLSPEHREKLRRRDLMRKYKISLEDYDQMVLNQNGLCLICERVPKKRLVVDHCHKTGKVRGLLCDPCNVALGFLEDDVTLLAKAIKYLL